MQLSAKILTLTLCQLLPSKHFVWHHLLKEPLFKNKKYLVTSKNCTGITYPKDCRYSASDCVANTRIWPGTYKPLSFPNHINHKALQLYLSAQRHANCIRLPTKTPVTKIPYTRFSAKSEIQCDTFRKNLQYCCILYRAYSTSNSVFKNQGKTCFAYA